MRPIPHSHTSPSDHLLLFSSRNISPLIGEGLQGGLVLEAFLWMGVALKPAARRNLYHLTTSSHNLTISTTNSWSSLYFPLFQTCLRLVLAT